MTIPATHPRLWWTPERITRAKAWVQKTGFAPKGNDIQLERALAHAVTGASCAEAISWAVGYEIPSFEGVSDALRWEGDRVVTIYDWCYDEMTADQRKTIVDRWTTAITKASKLNYGGPELFENNNYYWGYLRNDITFGIASYGENSSAPAMLEDGLVTRWEKDFLPFAKGRGLGGVPAEGTQYGTYMTDYPIIPFGTAALLGRSVFDETEFFKGTVLAVIYGTPQGQTTSADGQTGYEIFSYNDDDFWRLHNSANRYANFMAQAAINWDCLPIGKLARTWSKMVEAKPSAYLAAVDPGGETLDFTNLALDYYAPGARYFYGRSKWAPGATAFHWQMGDYNMLGTGHYQLDYGSFQIWRGGRWLSRETTAYRDNGNSFTGLGGSGEVREHDTLIHNSLLVNGRGFVIEAYDKQPDKSSTIVTRAESQPEYAYSVVDLTPAYRNADPDNKDRDNAAVNHVEREFVFLRELETMVILDRMTTNAAGSTSADDVKKTFIAHFEKNPTVDGNHVNYVSGDQALSLTVLLPATPAMQVVNEKTSKSAGLEQFRLEVTSSGSAESYFLTVLQAKDAAAPALTPTVKDEGGMFTVTLNATTSLVFTKGKASTGGSVKIGATTKNLRADVQTVSVTDGGPWWQ